MNPRDSLFFSSLFLSRLADQIILFMVPLVIFQMTGSGALSGLAFFFETLPRFLAFPIAGILCDLIAPYRIVSVSQRVRAVIIPFGLLGFYLAESIYWLMGMAALVGVATSFALMAREMILVQAFKTARFEKVLSYSSLASQLGMVLGPILAGLLLVYFSWQVSISICILLFLLSDLGLKHWWRFAHSRLQEEVKGLPAKMTSISSWCVFFYTQLTLACKQIIGLPGLVPVVLVAFCINLILGMTLASMAPIYTGLFAQSESAYALLQSLAVLVSLLILLFIARYSLSLVFMGATAFIAMCIGFFMTALSQDYLVYLVGFLLIVGFDKMFGVFLRSLRKELIPMENLGKSTGVLIFLNNLAQPLAGLIVALLAGVYLLQDLLLYTAIFVSVFGALLGAYLAVTARRRKSLVE
ncbi:hypothetical protein TW85_19115 [Marinomonas sp. S3726]|uniref:MFS transporter n=1 Tax=Marinomonas sp. S3726 TaxID=579484 RepID=UPI0005FA705F|nr:MFS transporter [Marinomonas sp. S3726]KJZ10834.1 hypothetical protein TW85_19115 [Marinomonas sp. S3726]